MGPRKAVFSWSHSTGAYTTFTTAMPLPVLRAIATAGPTLSTYSTSRISTSANHTHRPGPRPLTLASSAIVGPSSGDTGITTDGEATVKGIGALRRRFFVDRKVEGV